ncbi:MAG: SWIM zinc finger family protein [Cyanobacteria bacterium P01_F01_bin.150]
MPAANEAVQATGETIEQEWWVQRWVDLLNTYRFKKRLERGRIYAREGNILHMEFRKGKVYATVQGTADEPYKLQISIERFSDEDWDYVIGSIAEKAIYSAKLLAGTMPDDIEAVFTANGLSLFPFKLAEVRSRCNCPDPKNPCKHIAAVYYQLGDFFREDPFVLFELRGRSKSQILEAVRQKRSGGSPLLTSLPDAASKDSKDIAEDTANDNSEKNGVPESTETPSVTVTTESNSSEISSKGDRVDAQEEHRQESGPDPSPELDMDNFDPQAFWQYNEPLDPSLVVITPPGSAQTVLDVLGKMPLAPNDAQTVRQYLDTVYQSVSQQAMITALSRNG